MTLLNNKELHSHFVNRVGSANVMFGQQLVPFAESAIVGFIAGRIENLEFIRTSKYLLSLSLPATYLNWFTRLREEFGLARLRKQEISRVRFTTLREYMTIVLGDPDLEEDPPSLSKIWTIATSPK